MKKKFGNILSLFALVAFTTNVFPASYPIPSGDESIIGSLQYSSADSNQSIAEVGLQYDVGYNALENANPHMDLAKRLHYGTKLTIPTQHLLPNAPREGIVINLPEMRMYYYLPESGKVLTYPIGIGKVGKTIPIVQATITKKVENPTWVPPPDIREFNLKQGIILPKIMPPGPDNPLGPYAIYMSIPTFLIHSTIFPESIGKRASFGCIRMYESDIKKFFPSIQNGIPVEIINLPIKLAWHKNKLYVEAHHPLDEHSTESNSSLSGMVDAISQLTKNQPTLIDWQGAFYISQERDGIPHDIGIRIKQ